MVFVIKPGLAVKGQHFFIIKDTLNIGLIIQKHS